MVWRSIPPTEAVVIRAKASDALAAAGITLTEPSQADARTPALVLVGDLGAASCEYVKHLSAGGGHRVAVVPVPGLVVDTEIGWRLMALGASEILSWDTLLARPQILAARLQRWHEIDALLASPLIRNHLIGTSAAWNALLRRVIEAARFTTTPTLLLGESGTGKELLARLIHTLDPRSAKGDLIVLDCTTVAPELAGSEFFGHERGAFTNAHSRRDGAFAMANCGTLFLDEVGELPLGLQAQLLRVVQEKTYKRIGSNTWQQTEFRLVCATNRDLWEETTVGSFRRDLYYRLAGWVFRVPSLHERREDVLPLARHFLAAAEPKITDPDFDPAVAAYLTRRDYPGNVRDLRQLVMRAASRHVGDGPITFADIPEDDRPHVPLPSLPWPDFEFERAVERAMMLGIGLKDISRMTCDVAVRLAIQSRGNLQDAARLLGVSDRALQMRQAQTKAIGMQLN